MVLAKERAGIKTPVGVHALRNLRTEAGDTLCVDQALGSRPRHSGSARRTLARDLGHEELLAAAIQAGPAPQASATVGR